MKFISTKKLNSANANLWKPDVGESTIGNYVKSAVLKHGTCIFVEQYYEDGTPVHTNGDLLIIPESITLEGIPFRQGVFYRFCYESLEKTTKFAYKNIICEELEIESEVDADTGEVLD